MVDAWVVAKMSTGGGVILFQPAPTLRSHTVLRLAGASSVESGSVALMLAACQGWRLAQQLVDMVIPASRSINAANVAQRPHCNIQFHINGFHYKHFVIDVYLIIAGDYGVHGSQGCDYSYSHDSRSDTPVWWRWMFCRHATPAALC